MSTNLRLSDDLVAALREASVRRGRSQQDIVREAIAKELGLVTDLTAMQRAVHAGAVETPEPLRDVGPVLTLPPGRTTLDLLDRDDR